MCPFCVFGQWWPFRVGHPHVWRSSFVDDRFQMPTLHQKQEETTHSLCVGWSWEVFLCELMYKAHDHFVSSRENVYLLNAYPLDASKSPWKLLFEYQKLWQLTWPHFVNEFSMQLYRCSKHEVEEEYLNKFKPSKYLMVCYCKDNLDFFSPKWLIKFHNILRCIKFTNTPFEKVLKNIKHMQLTTPTNATFWILESPSCGY